MDRGTGCLASAFLLLACGSEARDAADAGSPTGGTSTSNAGSAVSASAGSGGTVGGAGPGAGGTNGGSGGALGGVGGSAAAGVGGSTTAGSAGEPAACDEDLCRFEWPLDGIAARDWIVTNYVDRVPGAGLLDYANGMRSYEEHAGVDVAIPNFRAMDAGVVVHAVAPGNVTAVHDGEDDRNMIGDPGSCSLTANSVYVQHPDGLEGRYLHFREGGIMVSVGQAIQAGDALGLVGSSGCSQSPHVHFELRDPQNDDAVIDPFFEDLWLEAPAYDVAPGVMDIVFKSGSISSTADVQESQPNPASVPSGTLGFSVITGGTLVGETLGVTLYEGDALHSTLLPYEYIASETLYMRWWNPTLTAGTWRADVSIGAQVVESVDFQLE
jgi:murein DD-endopeptidase MepM/ murein hydrolase activator NlpD